LELAIAAKDRDMEQLEDNHRVELRVYQQKVKHLEYEHRNNLKGIIHDGTNYLDMEQSMHQSRERELLKIKEQLKFERMEMELVNATKVSEIRSQHEKQIAKLRHQFEDSLSELNSRCAIRLKQLENDLELRRRVEIHEVEERKNQHINDLVKNHQKAFGQMQNYYNDITGSNLQLIKSLQKQVEALKQRAQNNKKMLHEYTVENQKLSEPLSKVSAEISELQSQLKERTKDQMALRNANSRLSSLSKQTNEMRKKYQKLGDDYHRVESERDGLYHSFEEVLQRIERQSDFQNQALDQRLQEAEVASERASVQVDGIIRAADLDANEIERVLSSLSQMILVKDEALSDVRFLVIRLKKQFNDQMESFRVRLKDLGVPEQEFNAMGFRSEDLPIGSTNAPAGLVVR
jgi:growth arrest-specific protein 8